MSTASAYAYGKFIAVISLTQILVLLKFHPQLSDRLVLFVVLFCHFTLVVSFTISGTTSQISQPEENKKSLALVYGIRMTTSPKGMIWDI